MVVSIFFPFLTIYFSSWSSQTTMGAPTVPDALRAHSAFVGWLKNVPVGRKTTMCHSANARGNLDFHAELEYFMVACATSIAANMRCHKSRHARHKNAMAKKQVLFKTDDMSSTTASMSHALEANVTPPLWLLSRFVGKNAVILFCSRPG